MNDSPPPPNGNGNEGSISAYQQKIHHRRQIIQSIKAKADSTRSDAEKLADWMTERFGSIAFFWVNFIFFVAWLILNSGLIPGMPVFDPYPFGMLTMIVSLEAIFLSIIVLISQNRAAKIADLREEIDFQVNVISETEITKVMKLLTVLLEKNGIDINNDPELKKMLEPVDLEKIKKVLQKQI